VGEAEIFFAHLDQARSQQIFGDRNFVFTGEMRHLLDRLLPAQGTRRRAEEIGWSEPERQRGAVRLPLAGARARTLP